MTHNPTSRFNLYHGTTLDNLSKILESKEFTIIPRDNHWLGNGVYFFVDDLDKALWWSAMATRRAKDSPKNRAILFIEDYTLQRNQLLDLDSEKDRNLMADFLKETPFKITMDIDTENVEEEMIKLRANLIA